MRITWPVIAGNVIVVQTALIAASYLYYVHRGRPAGWRPWWSVLLIGVTALVTGAQYIFPDVLPALRRDLDGLRDGEWWRVVTPLFVQPAGIGQVLSNALFLLMFVPLAEKLYGRGMLVLYFAAGLLVQIDRYYWDPTGGGSSSAAFGVVVHDGHGPGLLIGAALATLLPSAPVPGRSFTA